MAMEKKWEAVPPQTIQANGTSAGLIIIPDTSLLKVGQKVKLFSDADQPAELQVKRILSPTQLQLGLASKQEYEYSDLTYILVSNNPKISAEEQNRISIALMDHERSEHEEEPVVAKRVVLVDKNGRKYDLSNPLPTNATFTGSLTVNLDGEGVDGDTVGIVGENGDRLIINADGSMTVKDPIVAATLSSIFNLLNSGSVDVSDSAVQALLTTINSNLIDIEIAILDGFEAVVNEISQAASDIVDKLGTVLKTDDDETQTILNQIKTILQAGSIQVGTEDGKLTGVQRVFVNNIKEQILKASDRNQAISYADAGTKNQRIVTIDYTSTIIGAGAGFTARKTIGYTLVGTRYVATNLLWTLV